jgi:hypothetical protein
MSNTGQCGYLKVSRKSLSRSTDVPVTLGCRVTDCQQQQQQAQELTQQQSPEGLQQVAQMPSVVW